MQAWVETGDRDYHSQNLSAEGFINGVDCDFNNDGRSDVLLQSKRHSALFFNRGFRCFGFAREVDTSPGPAATLVKDIAENSQQAGTMADMGDDGAQERIIVSPAGEITAVTPALTGRRHSLCGPRYPADRWPHR